MPNANRADITIHDESRPYKDILFCELDNECNNQRGYGGWPHEKGRRFHPPWRIFRLAQRDNRAHVHETSDLAPRIDKAARAG